MTCHPDTQTQASRPGRTLGESVGGISEMDCSDWSNGIRYHIFVTGPDSEFKLSVGRTSPVYLLEIEDLFTQGWQPGRTVGEAVCGILVMDSSDWSNVIRHHNLDTRSDTEFTGTGVIEDKHSTDGQIAIHRQIDVREQRVNANTMVCGRSAITNRVRASV